jgi:hypothetical protein
MSPTTTEIVHRPNNGAEIVRQEFGAVQTQQNYETAAQAIAMREKTATEARYVVARHNRRNIEQFRTELLADCQRPTFAEKVEYAKPVGKKFVDGKWIQSYAYGPTIRFIETAIQRYGNVYPEVSTVHESPAARICRVSVTDLERNITYATEVVIEKKVERKGKKNNKGEFDPPEGREVVSVRLNSYNEPTFTVLATEDEVLVKQNALLSKALRTNAQRLLPYDIVEEAILAAKDTLRNHDAQNPDAAKRRLIDAFARLGVQPVDLESYLGKSINKPLVPAEIETLRAIYTAIKDGELTWEAVLASKEQTGSEELQNEVRDRKLAEAKAAVDQGKPAGETGEAKSAAAEPTQPEADAAAQNTEATWGGNESQQSGSAQSSTGAKKLQFGGSKKP